MGDLRLRGGLELKRTGLGEAARQAPGSTSGLAEAAGDPQPQRSRTSSSLEALLWWSPCRGGSADTHFLLSPQLMRSSSSSEEWRSRLASKRRRRRRNRAGERGPWLCCWLVAKGVRAQFLLRSAGEHHEEVRGQSRSGIPDDCHGETICCAEETHLCRSVPAPGSLPPSHHSPLPLHCHGKKSATLKGRISGVDCSLCRLERVKFL